MAYASEEDFLNLYQHHVLLWGFDLLCLFLILQSWFEQINFTIHIKNRYVKILILLVYWKEII